jgi:hypothetical protein
VTDAPTWISGDTPLLFDLQYAAKPAYTGVLDALHDETGNSRHQAGGTFPTHRDALAWQFM